MLKRLSRRREREREREERKEVMQTRRKSRKNKKPRLPTVYNPVVAARSRITIRNPPNICIRKIQYSSVPVYIRNT